VVDAGVHETASQCDGACVAVHPDEGEWVVAVGAVDGDGDWPDLPVRGEDQVTTGDWLVPAHEKARRQRELRYRIAIVSGLLAVTAVVYTVGWTVATIVCAVLTVLAFLCCFLTEPTLDQHDH
jgi:hypothetical protein